MKLTLITIVSEGSKRHIDIKKWFLLYNHVNKNLAPFKRFTLVKLIL